MHTTLRWAWAGPVVALAACVNLGGPSAEVPAATAFPDASDPLPLKSLAPSAGVVEEAQATSAGPKPGGATPRPSVAPSPTPGPFDPDPNQNQKASAKFAPQLSWGLSDLRMGATPVVKLSVYQTSQELEVREARFLLENTQFRFDRVSKGVKLGGGSLDIGTPPKLSLPIAITAVEVDLVGRSAVFSVIADGPGARVHVADLKIRNNSEGLSIVSLGNLSRANDADGTYLTPYSARVTQELDTGWLILPLQPVLRGRASFVSEPDQKTGEVAIQTEWPRFNLAP